MYPHIQSRIRAVVCLQSPHAGAKLPSPFLRIFSNPLLFFFFLLGTPIPSDILDGGVVSFVTGVVKPFDPAALRDLSYQVKQKEESIHLSWT